MSNKAAPQSIQPMGDLVRRLRAFHSKIMSEAADRIEFLEGQVEGLKESFNSLAEVANSHASLKARVEELTSQLETSRLSAHNAERSVDVLESNARMQAKLLADTGRRVEELTEMLLQARDFIDPDSGPVFVGNREMVRLIDAALPQSITPTRTEVKP